MVGDLGGCQKSLIDGHFIYLSIEERIREGRGTHATGADNERPAGVESRTGPPPNVAIRLPIDI